MAGNAKPTNQGPGFQATREDFKSGRPSLVAILSIQRSPSYFARVKFCLCCLVKLFKIYRQGPQTGMAEFHATPVYQESLPGVVQLELEGNQNAMALRRPFDPVAHDLDASFRLSRFADLKG